MPGFNYSRIIRAATQLVQGLVRQSVWDVRDYGGILDGNPHPLSASFATLAAAQVVWPEATALTNQIDRMAAQRALNAMSASGGVLYCSGTLVSDGVPLTRAINNVKIRGDGWGSSIKLAAGVIPGGAITANLIEITGVSGWTVEDLALDGNAGNNTTDNVGTHWHPIYSTLSDHVTVRRVKTSNSLSNGIFFNSGSYALIEDNWVDGGNLYNATTTYMSEGGIRCFADHSVIRRNHATNWWKECYVDAVACTIEGNTFVHGTVRNGDDNNIEVYAPTNQGLLSQRTIVRGNICENVWWEGIQIGGNSDNTICEGNIIRSSYAMLPAAPAAPAGTISLVAGNVDAGTHYYAYTDLVAGVESKLSPASVAFVNDGTHQQNSVTGIAVGPTGTTARNLYRTKVAGGTVTGPWFLVTTLANNTTTTYTDNTADAGLGAQLAQTAGFAGAATIQGQAVGIAGIGIYLLAPGCIVRGNEVEGFHRGIWGVNPGTDGSGTALSSATSTISNNHVFGGVQQDSDLAFAMLCSGDDALVTGNLVENGPILVNTVNRPLLHHNKVRNSPTYGIQALNSQDVTCSGNEVFNCAGNGIWVNNSDATLRRATITANIARAQTAAGYGILANGVSYGTIVGNISSGNAGPGLATQGSDHVVVSGNTSTGNTYGFRDAAFSGNSDFITVMGNEFRGNTTAAVLRGTGANSTYRGNAGYNPTGPQTPPAVPASTVAYTNAFGFDCTVHVAGGTVTVVAIGGTATGATSGAFRVPAGQTIAITYSVVPTWTWFGD